MLGGLLSVLRVLGVLGCGRCPRMVGGVVGMVAPAGHGIELLRRIGVGAERLGVICVVVGVWGVNVGGWEVSWIGEISRFGEVSLSYMVVCWSVWW